MADHTLRNNYTKSLSKYLFNKIDEYQNDPIVRQTKPMLWPSQLYITEQKLEQWIKEHNGGDYIY
jgi:hypothetical protein